LHNVFLDFGADVLTLSVENWCPGLIQEKLWSALAESTATIIPYHSNIIRASSQINAVISRLADALPCRDMGSALAAKTPCYCFATDLGGAATGRNEMANETDF
jgi:hypothetical protein